MKRPLFAVGIAYLAGTVVAVLFLGQYSFLAGIVCLCIGGICSFLRRNKFSQIGIILISFGLAFGVYTLFYTSKFLPIQSLHKQRGDISGIVLDSDIIEGSGSLVIDGKVNGVEDKFKILVCIKNADDIKLGDKISFKGSLYKIPQHYKYNYNSFSKGIFIKVYPEGDVFVEKNADGLYPKILELKQKTMDNLRSVVPEDVFATDVSMTLGNRNFLTREQKTTIIDSGIMHLTAVSGTHLVIIITLLDGIMEILRIRERKSAIISSLFILGFMAFTGFTFSVCRAGIMLLIMLSGKLIGREGDSLTSWGIASIAIISSGPFCAVNIGFLMSMLACLGINLFSDRIFIVLRGRELGESDNFSDKIKDIIVLNLSLSLGAHALILPILAFIFGYIPIFSPITTMLVAWLLPVIFAFTPLSAMFSGFGMFTVARIMGVVITVSVRILMAIARIIAEIPFSLFYTGEPYVLWWIVMAYIFMGILFAVRTPTSQKILGMLSCILVLLFGGVTNALLNIDVADLAVLGDVVVITEGKRGALIGNIKSEYNAQAISKYLASKGVRKIDIAMVTGSTDKSIGYVYLLQEIKAEQILVCDKGRYLPHIQKLMNGKSVNQLNNSEVSMFRGIKANNILNENGNVETVLQIGNKLVLKSNDSYDILLDSENEYSLIIVGENYSYHDFEGTKMSKNLYADLVVSYRY